MPSDLVSHFTQSLAPSRPISPSPLHVSKYNTKKPELHAILVSFTQSNPTHSHIANCARSLQDVSSSSRTEEEQIEQQDPEEVALENAIISKLTVAIYADAMDTYLAQAIEAEAEAEWWASIERSKLAVAWFLLQTFPLRVMNVSRAILHTLRANDISLSMSTISPSFLRNLFPSPSKFTLRPGALTTAFFPHLENQTSLALAVLMPPHITDRDNSMVSMLWSYLSFAGRMLTLPLELTRQECRYNRKTLEKIRDQRAASLGRLAQLRSIITGTGSSTQYKSFLCGIVRILSVNAKTAVKHSTLTPVELLLKLSTSLLPSLSSIHTSSLNASLPASSLSSLLRPKPLVLIWPHLLVLPPLSLYLYTSHTYWVPALLDLAHDAKDTLRGFVTGWLIEPLKDVLRTIRGGEGQVGIVKTEGVRADLESLERMTLSLASDILYYTPAQLESLARHIQTTGGELTSPIMQVYEQDIRTPIKSAIGGTLIRGILVQVQKAKVDIDQTLLGIDHLLKSQQLTFAFVGVAPALGIVYVLGESLSGLWRGGKGRGRWGGKRLRREGWEGMRRIERLLITQRQLKGLQTQSPPDVEDEDARSTGLLLLSLSRLRAYVSRYLPSLVRQAFLEDLEDLADPQLGREEKLLVVSRVWRCWGGVGGQSMT
ncbi:NCA2-domain-containing protein [Phlegmacium glaucopus]|nr:NCA2-domain-containing protein [Phlegmacium glaucopus]